MFKFIVNLLKKIPALHSFFKKLFHFINGNTMFGWNFGGGGGVIFDEEQSIYRKNFVSRKNKSFTEFSKQRNYVKFAKYLMGWYLPKKQLYSDEYFEERYGMNEVVKILNTGNKTRKILDIGCGNCMLIRTLNNMGYQNTSGIDASVVRVLTNRVEIKDLYFGFAEQLPFDENSYDAIITLETLEHVLDVEKALQEIKRVLRPNGELFIQVPLEDKVDHFLHVRLFSIISLKNLVNKYFTVKFIDAIPYRFGDDKNNIFCIANNDKNKDI